MDRNWASGAGIVRRPVRVIGGKTEMSERESRRRRRQEDDPCPGCDTKHAVYDPHLHKIVTALTQDMTILTASDPPPAKMVAESMAMAYGSVCALLVLACELFGADNELDFEEDVYDHVKMIKPVLLQLGVTCKTHAEFNHFWAEWKRRVIARLSEEVEPDAQLPAYAWVMDYVTWVGQASGACQRDPSTMPQVYLAPNIKPWNQ